MTPPWLDSLLEATNKVAGLLSPSSRVERHARSALLPRRQMEENLSLIRSLADEGIFLPGLSTASMRVKGARAVFLRPNWRRSEGESLSLRVFDIAEELGEKGDRHPHRMVHQTVYRHSLESSVLLSHPRAAMACATLGQIPADRWLPAARNALGGIALAQHSEEAVAEAVSTAPVLLVSGVGVLTTGSSLAAAAERLRILERWCQCAWIGADIVQSE